MDIYYSTPEEPKYYGLETHREGSCLKQFYSNFHPFLVESPCLASKTGLVKKKFYIQNIGIQNLRQFISDVLFLALGLCLN